MTLHDRIRRIVDPLPPGASVSLPADVLRSWLEQADEDAPPPAPDECFDLTVASAAELVGRAPSTVRGWCASGTLPGAYRLQGREWRVPRASLAALRNGPREKSVKHERRQPALDEWRRA